jgi:hypothetical protein
MLIYSIIRSKLQSPFHTSTNISRSGRWGWRGYAITPPGSGPFRQFLHISRHHENHLTLSIFSQVHWFHPNLCLFKSSYERTIICDNVILVKFFVGLNADDRLYCLISIAGGCSSLTFSTLSNLHWILHMLWDSTRSEEADDINSCGFSQTFRKISPKRWSYSHSHHCIVEISDAGDRIQAIMQFYRDRRGKW